MLVTFLLVMTGVGGDSAPRGHREMSGDFCGCHTVGGFRRQLDRGCSTPHSAQAGPTQRMTCTSVQAQRGLTGLDCLVCSSVCSPEPGPRWALPKDVRSGGDEGVLLSLPPGAQVLGHAAPMWTVVEPRPPLPCAGSGASAASLA